MINDFTTEQLFQELIRRKALKKIDTGLYKPFELRQKYEMRDKEIEYDDVYLFRKVD